MRQSSSLLFVLGILSLMVACEEGGAAASPGVGDASVEEAQSAMGLSSSESALFVMSVSGLEQLPASGQEAAQQMAQALPSSLELPDCVTVSSQDNTNLYTFDGCAGPYGVTQLGGSLQVSYAVEGTSVVASLTSQDLTVGSTSLELVAQVTYQPGRQQQTLTVRVGVEASRGSVEGVSRQGDATLVWEEDSGCIAVDAAFSGDRERRSTSTTVESLAWCQGGCPEEGGVVTYVDSEGNTVVLTLDGSDQPAWTLTTSRGQERSGQLSLSCQP